MRCGLLGRYLGHSFSPRIHSDLGAYSYDLFEKEPEEIEDFLKHGDFTGINVTIPYKQAVIPYLDELSPIARQLGAVNTVIRRSDGTLLGHNTDYSGFASMVRKSGLSVEGKKCLVLGSGGASRPVIAVLEAMGGRVTVITHRENTPQNLAKHGDAAILVNTSPVGMYPNAGQSPVDLALLPRLEGVLDLIYNPTRTALLLQAEQRSLVAMGGLWMLVAQAVEAARWFTGREIPESQIAAIHGTLKRQTENIILIGMPGCGKTTIGKALSEKLGRRFVDADAALEQEEKRPIPTILHEDGEEAFRRLEARTLSRLGMESGLVIATGGGCVTRQENYPSLHQNGRIFWLQRDLALLPTDGRPLSQSHRLTDLYEQRKDLYAAFADHIIDNNGTTAISQILSILEETT